MFRSPVWSSNRFFEEEQKLTNSQNTEVTEANRIQFKIVLPIVKENDSGVPYSNTYYSIPQRQKWFFRVAQCRSEQNYYDLYHDLEEEDAHLGHSQKMLMDIMQSHKEPTNQEEYDVIYKNALALIELTRARLTAIETEYYVSCAENQVTDKTRLLKKDYYAKMCAALGYLAIVSEHILALMKEDEEENCIQLRLQFFSIYSSFRNATFPFFEESCLVDEPTILSVLIDNYYACFINDVQHFNIDYFKQIIGEELQATMDMCITYGSSIYPNPTNFKLYLGMSDSYRKIGDVYLRLKDYKQGIDYLRKAADYLVVVAENAFEHLEISHECPFGTDIPEVFTKPPELQLLEPGQPQINELSSRGEVIYNLRTMLEDALSHVNENDITDSNLYSDLRELKKRLTLVLVLVSEKRLIEAGVKVLIEIPKALPAPSVEEKPKQVKPKKGKRKPHKDNVDSIKTKTEEVYTPLPSLPPLTYTQPVVETLTTAPTVRISPEEIAQNKKLKQERYEEEEKKKTDFQAQQPALMENTNEFEYEFESVVSGKKIKARLDYQACIRTMGEAAFNEILPELSSLLDAGREAGIHGTGIKFVSRSEKRAMGLPENAYCFKLKPHNHKVRIYGIVVKQNGEDKITFNMPRCGKLHDTVAHLPKLRM